MPLKNEEWILKTTIPHLKKFTDEIICLDGGSTDGTVAYLKSAGVHVRPQNEKKTNFSAWRRELLDWGRERGGTHFVWLDADEAFTTNFLEGFRDRLSKMKPGEKLALQWLCLWKSPYVYRDDTSIWSNLYKDFIVCDDPKTSFDNTLIHEGRTPGPNTNPDGTISWTKIPLDEGSVLHFQFVPFKRFQIKQAYQRCRELVMSTGSALRINNKYSVTLDDPNARIKSIPPEWLADIGTGGNLEAISSVADNWFMAGIMVYFKEKGSLYFEPLQIWHVPELKEYFIKENGRTPKSRTYPAFVICAKKLLDKTKNKIRTVLK